MLPYSGQSIYIQSFKHNGTLHRTWAKGYVMEATEERIVCVTNKTWVSESDGRKWITREPAIYFFYPDRWYNVISMIRKTGIYYYCNIASPSIYDGESLKNIDYDLDLKVNPQYRWNVLDEDEYEEHAVEMGYSLGLKRAIEKGLNQCIDCAEDRVSPFDHEEVLRIYNRYLEETQG